jgi:acetylornithine deacetylase/succinyl-diaminopimelate desuccinylase-like protein
LGERLGFAYVPPEPEKSPTNPGAAPAAHAEVPEWFKPYAPALERIQGLEVNQTDLVKRIGKIKDRLDPKDPGAHDAPRPNGDAPKAPTVDPAALLRIGRNLSALPEKVAARLEARLSEGASLAEIEGAIELVQLASPAATVGASPDNGIRGHGATPAASDAPQVSTLQEFQELQQSDPGKAKALLEVLDITTLPHF